MYCPSFSTKSNGVPILRKVEIEIIAENFLHDFNPKALDKPTPVDVDRFCTKYLGLQQDFQYLSHNGVYLGMIVFNETDRVEVYDPYHNRAEYLSVKPRTVIIDNTLLEDDQQHRYRYTMIHECGHDIFHRAYFGYNPNQLRLFDEAIEPMIKCRKPGINKPVSEWTNEDSMEWQANYFASAFLMPKKMVLQAINYFEPNANDPFQELGMVNDVINHFKVSSQAAEYRLKELGLMDKNAVIL